MIQILPIGTPVWVADPADPGTGRRDRSGDGIVVSHMPCTACWARYAAKHRFVTVTPDTYRKAAADCRRPAGMYVAGLGRPIAITPDSPAIAVPITSDERSAA
ncbi:hypothetical protein AB0F24_17605 [Streptomyces platensis]|uniref:hypothetical protein n=1 Tax=Streptomyces platensis TaxID=58346 RepID=UPI003402076B